MIEAIEEYDFAAIRERADDREVRHVSGGEEQRALAPGEGGDFFFERGVLAAVTCDEMRSSAAHPGARRSFAQRRDDLRVAGQTQIVVAAEVDEALALDHDFRTILFNGKRIDRPLPSPQMLAIDPRTMPL